MAIDDDNGDDDDDDGDDDGGDDFGTGLSNSVVSKRGFNKICFLHTCTPYCSNFPPACLYMLNVAELKGLTLLALASA